MKDPAFLFYYQDWLVGTYFLNRREKGAYMDLLCYQADKGVLTIQIIKEILNSDFDCWKKLSEKFIEEEGIFYNKRLKIEKEKRENFTNSRRNNRVKHDKICKTYDSHMENENENENINEDINEEEEKKERKIKKFIAPTIEEVESYFNENGYTLECAHKAFNYYALADWHDSKGNKVKNWKQKMQAVWFKDENRVKPEKKRVDGYY